MAKKKQDRAVWFRMYRNLRNMVEAVPDESVGAALKAVFVYFDTGALPDNLDTLGYALFLSMKPAVDESNEDYRMAVERASKASRKRWMQEDASCMHMDAACMQVDAEEEKETDKELEKELYPETEPPLRPLPKALVREMDFNDRREQALEKLRGYPA